MIVCIGFADNGIDQPAGWSMNAPPARSTAHSIILLSTKRNTPANGGLEG